MARKKRRGSRRFSDACKREFRICQRNTLKETGSMREAGKKCMKQINQCARTRGRIKSGRRR